MTTKLWQTIMSMKYSNKIWENRYKKKATNGYKRKKKKKQLKISSLDAYKNCFAIACD